MVRYITHRDEAVSLLGSSERILVIGCSGSGKSTFSQTLSRKRSIPYVSMDRDVFWLPGWQMRPRAEAIERVRASIAEPRWIMDGTSPGSLPLRLPRADLVIWMRPPRFVSLAGVILRWIRFRGKTRPEMAVGCLEKIDREFLRYIWTFEKKQVPEIDEMLAIHGRHLPVHLVKSYRHADWLLERLAPAQSSDRVGIASSETPYP
jgi:adenylate kinase family enzyme